MIQLIQSIAYVRPTQVVEYIPFPAGEVRIQVEQWTTLSMHPASGEMQTSGNEEMKTTILGARLKDDPKIIDKVILQITLCTGESYILGSPDIPVDMHTSYDLSLYQLSVNLAQEHGPLKVYS